AVWAVAQAGYRAVIAPGKGEGFADIFEGNAFNNGLLPIELADDDWKDIADAGKSPGGAEVTIDLRDCSVTLHQAGKETRFSFDVPENDRNRLLKGLDFIAETLLSESAITHHEQNAPAWITPRPA
ncbi:3-isopropylmalate dehydratase small subunit, partial [Singulisphaera rosea]